LVEAVLKKTNAKAFVSLKIS